MPQQGSDGLLNKKASCWMLTPRQYWNERDGRLYDQMYIFRKVFHMYSTILVDIWIRYKNIIFLEYQIVAFGSR